MGPAGIDAKEVGVPHEGCAGARVGAAEPLEGVVLRRRSYPVMYWGGTAGACGAAVAVVVLTFGRDDGGGPVLAVAFCLGFIVLIRRIMGPGWFWGSRRLRWWVR